MSSSAQAVESPPKKFYTISAAARTIGTYYNRLIYALGKKQIKLYQDDPELIEEDELKRFAIRYGYRFKEK